MHKCLAQAPRPHTFQIMVCLLMREIALTPDLPKSHCRVIFRCIVLLALSLVGGLVLFSTYQFSFRFTADTFISVRTSTAFHVSAIINLSTLFMIIVFVRNCISGRATIRIGDFVIFIVGYLKTIFFRWNDLTRYVGLYSALIHICVYFGAVISFVRTNCLCFKTIFIDLCFDSFGMNRTVIDVSGRDKNICDQAVLAITGLVAKIMEAVRLTGTMHISAFGVSCTYFDLLGLRCLFFFVVFF